MNRRLFVFDLLSVCTLGLLSQSPKPHTDFEYAAVVNSNLPNRLSPNADPRPKDMHPNRDVILTYLNGKPIRGVQEANAVEGWMDVIPNMCGNTVVRMYGSVQLLWNTPERRAEFIKLFPDWA